MFLLLRVFYLKEISAYKCEYAADIISRQRAADHSSNTNQLKFIISHIVTNYYVAKTTPDANRIPSLLHTSFWLMLMM
jgi:hypothetical protein